MAGVMVGHMSAFAVNMLIYIYAKRDDGPDHFKY